MVGTKIEKRVQEKKPYTGRLKGGFVPVPPVPTRTPAGVGFFVCKQKIIMYGGRYGETLLLAKIKGIIFQ